MLSLAHSPSLVASASWLAVLLLVPSASRLAVLLLVASASRLAVLLLIPSPRLSSLLPTSLPCVALP